MLTWKPTEADAAHVFTKDVSSTEPTEEPKPPPLRRRPRLVDAQSLALLLGCGRTKVWRLARAGRIPYYAIGRRWLFDPDEVLAAIRVPALGEARQPQKGDALPY